jgi:dihydrofolate synthase/folylpolyglutamate synthase
MTAMASLQFARKKCDVSVIEVGMGGRLDATNVVLPEVSVITSISLDHCEMLGNTVEQIAREKAGIIKPGRPVVLGHLPAAAEAVIRSVAAEQQAPVFTIAEEYGDDLANYPQTRLEGDYQRWNAATASLTVKVLGKRWAISPEIVEQGLRTVEWPGRWERAQLGGRPIILDASHNPEGAGVLDIALQRLVAEFGRAPVVVTGVLGAARAAPLIETICRYAKEIHFVVPNQARACSHEELVALVPKTISGKIVRATLEDLFPNASTCTAGTADDVVVVTGSIYLLGEVLSRIQPERGANENRLQDF